ncbi:MAG: DUF4252 domain-containing protein [Bacteroidia bacterium]|nr:DUF4252 domain-containing protein [Bacteroidia bacterium]NND25086.1 DUF4252 domain-containing protein [Flavobacteriaceae bacterium]MBT8279424.1 DUF4252 domain-containing protein [Bacteroidia bacterium]NNK59360.1 DUF4252 domain-containing protein [Flavobacteriaceae bacterium]NNL33383.1 DUF4252 domain-containing protein [Flavobacteriaceae bacterium]
MYQSIKNSVVVLFLVAVLTSCNQGETLQGYYVANQESPNFISVDVPSSFVNVENIDLTEDQKEAYDSVDKLNMLGYTLTEDNVEAFNAELIKIKTILADEKYQELIRGGNSRDGKFVVKYIGTDHLIDELIIFGSATEKGFAIIRVLGDDMNPAKILKLGDVINQMETEENSIKEFMDFFQ